MPVVYNNPNTFAGLVGKVRKNFRVTLKIHEIVQDKGIE